MSTFPGKTGNAWPSLFAKSGPAEFPLALAVTSAGPDKQRLSSLHILTVDTVIELITSAGDVNLFTSSQQPGIYFDRDSAGPALINMISSAEFIELIVGALPTDAGQRDESILREALQRLVKVARLEQVQAIENDFDAVDNLMNIYRRSANGD